VFHLADFEDERVLPENAFAFALPCAKRRFPFDLHIYQQGKHGIGPRSKDLDPEKLHRGRATAPSGSASRAS